MAVADGEGQDVLSHPSRGAWIEMKAAMPGRALLTSHPSRGAWIEIVSYSLSMMSPMVAPLTGCVD